MQRQMMSCHVATRTPRSLLDVGLEGVQGHRFRALDGQTHNPGPHEVGHATQGAGHGKDDGVVVLLSQAVALHARAREGVHVGPGVLDLARGLEHRGDRLVAHIGELEERVIREVFLGEVPLDHVAGIGLPQHAVTETGDDLASSQGVLRILSQHLDGRLLSTQVLVRVLEPAEALLVSQAVQWASEAANASSVCVVRVAERAADEMRGVRGDVATLVIRMEHEVEAGDLLELLGVVDSQHLCVVACPVQGGVARDVLAVEEDVAEDAGGQEWDLTDQIQRVLEGVNPVIALLASGAVGLAELAARLQSEKAHRELGHRVNVTRKVVDEFVDVLRDVRSFVQLLTQCRRLGRSRHLIGEQQPQGGLGQADLATGRSRELRHALLERPATVPDALHGVQKRGLAQEALNASGTTDAHADGDFADRRVRELLAKGHHLRGLLLRQGLDLVLQSAHDRAGRVVSAARQAGCANGRSSRQHRREGAEKKRTVGSAVLGIPS
mmetsp:Transcript_154824/g.495083  ORF Transcript_154824/g.495083 Transcript_154824/m.495083 type:complete len:497 (-) Transcript_154824:26-1516(-)